MIIVLIELGNDNPRLKHFMQSHLKSLQNEEEEEDQVTEKQDGAPQLGLTTNLVMNPIAVQQDENSDEEVYEDLDVDEEGKEIVAKVKKYLV